MVEVKYSFLMCTCFIHVNCFIRKHVYSKNTDIVTDMFRKILRCQIFFLIQRQDTFLSNKKIYSEKLKYFINIWNYTFN